MEMIREMTSGGATGSPEMMLDLQGGAGVQVLTRGRDVQVPAETALMFRLDKSVTLQADY